MREKEKEEEREKERLASERESARAYKRVCVRVRVLCVRAYVLHTHTHMCMFIEKRRAKGKSDKAHEEEDTCHMRRRIHAIGERKAKATRHIPAGVISTCAPRAATINLGLGFRD